MDNKKQLINLGFTKENENTFFYKLSKERKLVVDINVIGSISDSIHIEQYEDVCFLCYFKGDISVIKNLLKIIS